MRIYDSNDNEILKLYQWDADISIYIDIEGTITPTIHFTQKGRKGTLVITPTRTGDVISTQIPNILLQSPYPISIYLYYTDTSGKRTIEEGLIPVVPRVKPSEYEYVENTQYTSFLSIKQTYETALSELGKVDDIKEEALEAVSHYPTIDTVTHNWKVWDTEDECYKDTGVCAQGSATSATLINWTNVNNKPFSTIGSNLKVVNGTLSVDVSTGAEEDNTKPITSAAVFTEIGNINALLETI